MHIRDFEGLHQHRFGFVFFADDANHFVNVQEGHQIALQNMNAPLYSLEPVFKAPLDRCLSKRQPLFKDGDQRLHSRPAIDTNHIEIDSISALEIGRRKQVAHHVIEIDAVRPGHQDQARGMFVI